MPEGQSGIDRAALFAFDDPAIPSRRALYPVVLPLIVVLVLAALKLDDALHPPLWVHLLLWPPVVTLAMFGAISLVKRAHPSQRGQD